MPTSEDTGIYQIVYHSRSRIGDDPLVVADSIRDILRASRTTNLRLGITGSLLFNGTNFAQVLEGRRAAVLSMLGCIAKDPRHRDVTVVQERWVPGRDFGSWAMGYVDRTSPRLLRLSPSADFLALLPDGRGQAIVGLLRYLVQDEDTP